MNSRSSHTTDVIWTDIDDQQALDRYRELVTVIDEAIFHLDSSGHFTAVSDAMLGLTGHARADLIGEPLSVLLGADDAHRVQRDGRSLADSTGDSATFELSVSTADGRSLPCELRATALVADGEFQGLIGVARDFSERVLPPTLESPQSPDDVLSTILEKLDGGIFILDDNLDVVWANDTIGQYFGVDTDALVGRNKREVVRELIQDRVADPEAFADNVFAGYDGDTYVQEFVCEVTPGKDREQRWIEHWSRPIESGQFAGGRIEIYTEVTEQKETANALHETEERFSSLVDAVSEYAIFRLDPEGRVLSWNDGAQKLKGYEPEEILGEHFSRFYTESDRAAGRPDENLAKATETGSVEDEGWRLRKDGSRFWASVTISTIRDDDGTHQGFLKVARDMTDRYEREQELESELRRIFERISDAFYALDEQWRFTHVNEPAEELVQQSREELIGKRLWDVFPGAADTIIWDRYHEAVETQKPVSFDLEYESLDIWVEVTAYPSESGLSVYFRDITDRLEKERQIRERERELTEYKEYTDKILSTIDDMFYVIDESGTFQRWNDTLSTMTGYTDAEIESMGPQEFVAEEDRETIERGMAEVFETGGARIEAAIRTREGDRVPMEFAASAVETPDGETVLAGIGRDITEQIEREQALEESNERLEQFAHAASHDLQEPLRMVSSYLRLIERRYEDQLGEEGKEFLEFAVDGADRMREMIDGLLTYSRIESKGDPFEPVELDTVFEEACEDLHVAIEEHDAEVTSDSLPRVEGDQSQLRQLVENLMDNAIEYSGDEPPRIHVSAERGRTGTTADRASAGHEADGETWTISVRDEGIGVDPSDQDRIFEVFQSLEGPDENGSGIGLALGKRIVERHGGDIWIDSARGEGTTVLFTLPPAGESNE